jgi:hypothetical protein
VVSQTGAHRLKSTFLALVAGLAVCAPVSHATATASIPAPAYALPPANAAFDYQIGTAYPPPAGVRVVSRDRQAPPAAGLYNICYVNAFQAQPAEVAWWQRNHDDLLLRDGDGEYVVDDAWNEIVLDIRTPAKRAALAGIVNGWIDGCAAAGFQAVEPDNIDTFDRFDDLLTREQAVAFLGLLAPHAHAAGLAIGQKNTTSLEGLGRAAGLDFAIAEECGEHVECGDYAGVYGANVIDIEYTAAGYEKACAAVGATLTVVQRDLEVTAPGGPDYIYAAC